MSNSGKTEYCCTVVKIGQLTPIEGSDFLSKTEIMGTQIVVRKDQVHEGDIMFYSSNETSLNEKFLSVNNLFEIGCRELNSNYEEVKKIMDEYDSKYRVKADELRNKATLIKKRINSLTSSSSKNNKQISKLQKELDEYNNNTKIPEDGRIDYIQIQIKEKREKIDTSTALAMKLTVEYTNLKKEIESIVNEGKPIVDEAKKQCGFFNKYGRVRCITLKGEPSFGFVFGLNEMEKYCPEIKNINLEEHINEDFDTVNGELFVKAFVPPIKPQRERREKINKANKKISRFDRIIDGEFSFHYETQQLGKFIHFINPDDEANINVKIHGSSVCIGKLHVKEQKKIAFPKRIWNKFVDNTGLFKSSRFIDYNIVYGPIYSSRKVIKNQYINKEVTPGYYGVDIYSEYGDIIYPYLDEGMTVYGEIFGYLTGSQKMIQKHYDYGCNEGENKIMFYRITTTNDDGSKKEWEVNDVYNWTIELIERMKNDNNDNYTRIHPIDILYYGTFADLYPELDTTKHWHENFIEKLKNDKENFGMEELEPLCQNEVPREGVCIRIVDSKIPCCYKQKCQSFLFKEALLMDAGEVDMEMMDNYGDSQLDENN